MKRTTWLFCLFLLCSWISPNFAQAKDSDRNRIEVRGVIAALSESSVQVGSSTFQLTTETEYRDQNDAPISLSAFAIGDLVKVKGQRVGQNLIALEMEKESDLGGQPGDDDDDSDDDGDTPDDSSEIDRVIRRGRIDSISAGEITVAETTFAINGSTEYENIDDSAATFGDFSVGDLVKVKGYYDGSETLIAIEVEFEDDFHEGGERSGSTPRNSTVRLVCSFPQLPAVESGIAKGIREALLESGVVANVTAKGKIISRDNPQAVSGAAAAPGLGLQTDTTNNQAPVNLVGTVEATECDGSVRFIIKVEGRNSVTRAKVKQTLTKDLAIKGVLAANSSNRSRGR